MSDQAVQPGAPLEIEGPAGASDFHFAGVYEQASSAAATSLKAQVAREVAALQSLGLEGLRAAWRERYGLPPKLRSPQLLRLSLAWRIQADAFGGLDAGTKRRLRRNGAGAAAADSLQPGVRLTREWKGAPHEVVVEESGFRYEGRVWKSLSEIARHISGSRWNGPRFFGLRVEAGRAKTA